MVEYYFGAHDFHKTVKTFCRNPLEERIRFPVVPDAVHNVAALIVLVNHSIYGVNVILQIRIHTDGRIAVGQHRHKTSQHRILMPFIVSQADAGIHRVPLTELLNDFPGTVPAPVIHKTDFTVFADFSSLN